MLCGLPSINAGISGARSVDLIRFAAAAITVTRPSRVVFASGINDLLNDPAFDLQRWTAQTTELVDQWHGPPIIIGVTETPGAKQAMAARMNHALRALAQRKGGVFVDGISPAETFDQVHPSLTGAAAWRARVDAGCHALKHH
jgi:lysophospholipase L1-like esterase